MSDMKFKFTIQPYQTEAVESVTNIFFVAETKGTLETLNLKPIEKAKIDCARKLFKELSGEDVVYDSVDSYQHLLDIIENL